MGTKHEQNKLEAATSALLNELRDLSDTVGRDPVTFACVTFTAGMFVQSGISEKEFVNEARSALRHARTAKHTPLRPASENPGVASAEQLDDLGREAVAFTSFELITLAHHYGIEAVSLAGLAHAAVQSAAAGDSEQAFCRLARLAYGIAVEGLAGVSGASA
jgi:hypothetical protein